MALPSLSNMRILHTSDWHLGRSFLGVGMLVHQAAFLEHLLDVVESREVDLVVVSGDVYDRALPPGDAVALLDDTLVRLGRSRAQVVLTSGNHDSALRLGFASRLLAQAGIHVRTRPEEVGEPVVLADEHGPVVVHALPFLDPDHLHHAWGLPARTHEAALGEAMRRVRADLAQRPEPARSVVMAHAFVAGVRPASPSDSERDLSVGGVQVVPAAVFDAIDYVALGHLHGPATLSAHVRYSGSPLAYSFSEAAHTKGCWLVDLDAGGLAHAEHVPAPVPRALVRLRGHLEDLLHDPVHDSAEPAWVQAVLTDPVRPRRAKPRLEERFPHVLSIGFEPEGARPAVLPAARTGAGVGDHQVALDFVRDVTGREVVEPEAALLREALEQVGHDRDQERDRRRDRVDR